MKIPTDKFTQIDQAAQAGAFGINPVPLPSDKQLSAGNYKKGKVSLYGLTIAIEQPQNSYRTGVDKNGKRWSCRLAANYGYILRTQGNDGDHVDCFIGSYPQSDRVFIINQFVNGVFDEHKVMLCYPTVEFASSDYRYSYARGWNGLHSIVETSVKNFKRWLKNGDMSKPITADQLPPESEKDMKVFWDSANQPIGTNTAQLLYDLRKLDANDGLLLDAVSIGDFILDADAGSVDFGVILDSLHTPYSSLARVCSKIGYAMKNQAATDSQGNPLTLVEPTADEPNPSGLDTTFKRNGVVNLAAVYRLTDGQSFTIVFHNPDSTPGKLAKTDTLIAWKFLLNKRDITIVVAPEKGEDLKLPEVAKRVMDLAAKNSAAFARANKGVAERVALISGLKTEIAELEAEKTQVQADYEKAKAAYDDREITKPIANNPVQLTGKNTKDGNSTENPNSSTGIDPVTLANLNAASISAAIRKKAIAFFEKNPSAKSFEGSGLSRASQKSIMESIKTALFVEIKALSPLFKEDSSESWGILSLGVNNKSVNIGVMQTEAATTGYSMKFTVTESDLNTVLGGNVTSIFDSTKTLKDLRSWGFALPFDLNVKAFVVNVIKPVVDEFLSKQQVIEQELKTFTEMDGVKVGGYYKHNVFGNVSVTNIVESSSEKAGLAGRSLYDVEFVGGNDKPMNQGLNSFKEDIAAGEAEKSATEKISKDLSDWSSWYRNTVGDFPSDKLSQEAYQKAQNGEDLIGFGVLPSKKTASPFMITQNKIDTEIETLRGLIGKPEFDTRIDALIEDIDSKGLMAQYEPKLLELDRDHANAKAAKARG